MKKIYVMRHAKALHNSKIDDHERPLHEQGIAACKQVSSFLLHHHYIPEQVLCSTAQRTRMTATVLAEGAFAGVPLRMMPSLYQAGSSEILREIHELDNGIHSVCIIGHNPGLSHIALLLAGSGEKQLVEQLRDGLPPAGFVALSFTENEWRNIHAYSGVLEALYVT
jgi:phosphohistidine phosphatase